MANAGFGSFVKGLVALLLLSLVVFLIIYFFFPDLSVRFFGITFRGEKYVKDRLPEEVGAKLSTDDIVEMIKEHGGSVREMISDSGFTDMISEISKSVIDTVSSFSEKASQ